MSERGDGTDEDALWRSIVANYGERASLEPEDEPDEPRPVVRRAEPAPVEAWVERHPAEEHFTPPEPPATTLPEPRRLLAWLGVLGVPVLLLLLVVFDIVIPEWGSLLMMIWFLGGFAYLVATMRRDDEDGDGDDGAVV